MKVVEVTDLYRFIDSFNAICEKENRSSNFKKILVNFDISEKDIQEYKRLLDELVNLEPPKPNEVGFLSNAGWTKVFLTSNTLNETITVFTRALNKIKENEVIAKKVIDGINHKANTQKNASTYVAELIIEYCNHVLQFMQHASAKINYLFQAIDRALLYIV